MRATIPLCVADATDASQRPNPASVRLHQRFGYRHVGTFTEQGRKFGRYWDVAWFERAFPDRVAEEAS